MAGFSCKESLAKISIIELDLSQVAYFWPYNIYQNFPEFENATPQTQNELFIFLLP